MSEATATLLQNVSYKQVLPMTMFGFPKNNISNCIYIDFNFLIWIIFYSYLVPPMTTTMTTTCSFIFIENFSLQSLRKALRRKEGRT